MRLLVVPRARPMNPSADRMSPEVVAKLNELAAAGSNILIVDPPTRAVGLIDFPGGDELVEKKVADLLQHKTVRKGPWREETLESLNVLPDFIATKRLKTVGPNLAWAHRATDEADIYFVANQDGDACECVCTLRSKHRSTQIWDPVTGSLRDTASQPTGDGRMAVTLELAPYQSVFLVLQQSAAGEFRDSPPAESLSVNDGQWAIEFHSAIGPSPPSIEFAALGDLSRHSDAAVKHFAGKAVYRTTLAWERPMTQGDRLWLDLGHVANVASVRVNDQECGVAWTAPWRVEITDATVLGKNQLAVSVFGTWRNRLLGDRQLSKSDRRTWTTATTPLDDAQLVPFGLLGPVQLIHSATHSSQGLP